VVKLLTELLAIFFSAAIVNNFVLTRFLGICPFLAISRRTDSALGMGIAVTFVMLIATVATWLIHALILIPFELPFLRYVSFILVIASLVQFIELFMNKFYPEMYRAFGIFLPLITTNCAILGLALINIIKGYALLEGIAFALGAGTGFTLALLIMSGIRERLEFADTPESLRGIPIALIIAGLLALAFTGFGGIL
jgi:electron transport complex protein RnfA